MPTLNPLQQQAFGFTQSHLVNIDQAGRSFAVHKDMQQSFLQLQQAALAAGFNLQLVSSFRDFSRQYKIYSAKAAGQRALLDDAGKALDFNRLDNKALLYAILRWSALPGASRHHWGSDIDIFDANKKDIADVELVPNEVNGDGPFAPLHDWLSERIANNESFGFYRPYEHDLGGIAPERWHLSYAPVSLSYEKVVNREALLALFKAEQLPLLDEITENFDDIFTRFIQVAAKNRPNWVLVL